MLELYYWPTPNGKKVTILLEELGVAHTIKPVNIGRGDQFDSEFLKFSPNNRMPALVDTAPKGGGAPIRIFESGAIMMYVAEREGRFFPQDTAKKYDVIQWVMWQMGNQGPKFGEQGHFARASQNAANGDLTYAVTRFSDEVHRLYGVMNLGLHNKEWLAAGEYTIADMICYPWASGYKLRKIDLDEFPNVKRWMERVEARPAVKAAMEAALPPDAAEDPNTLSDEEKARRAKLLTNQRATKIPAAWGRALA
ncbi:MAG: glutathione binding-like protein [Rhizomicrobium sp.]